jgi:hypothetical protein
MNYDLKKKGMNKFDNLISNHKSLESRGQMKFNWAVLYTIEKIFLKILPSNFFFLKFEIYMSVQNFGTIRFPILGLPFGSPREKITFGCCSCREAQNVL